jgi:RNA recognition motif-containing protein
MGCFLVERHSIRNSLNFRFFLQDVEEPLKHLALRWEYTGMNKRLFVGNLPYRVEENDLQDLFSQAGSVESVRVMRDVETGRARGFAFVEMASEQDAERAANQFNQFPLEGRKLTVNEARPMPERRAGNNAGGMRRQEPRW